MRTSLVLAAAALAALVVALPPASASTTECTPAAVAEAVACAVVALPARAVELQPARVCAALGVAPDLGHVGATSCVSTTNGSGGEICGVVGPPAGTVPACEGVVYVWHPAGDGHPDGEECVDALSDNACILG